ncbi:MAG: hypothetical protein NT107_00215 [Planctomycetota bacterium]|nr:hypothetical protein [Planctomycetota bacterium]
MSSPQPARVAPVCFLHKATGQAAVKLGGRFVYLGKWDSEAAQAAYLRVTAEWRVSGRVVVRAQVYYRKDGVTTSEVMAVGSRAREANIHAATP